MAVVFVHAGNYCLFHRLFVWMENARVPWWRCGGVGGRVESLDATLNAAQVKRFLVATSLRWKTASSFLAALIYSC